MVLTMIVMLMREKSTQRKTRKANRRRKRRRRRKAMGLTLPSTSPSTTSRSWKRSRKWLLQQLGGSLFIIKHSILKPMKMEGGWVVIMRRCQAGHDAMGKSI
jgi:hypothetical protein